MSRKVATKKKGRYSVDDHRQAAVLYLMFGNAERVSEKMNIPVTTIKSWKNDSNWWGELIDECSAEIYDELKARSLSTVSKAFDGIEERLELGDEVMKSDGTMVRRKMSGRDVAWVGGVFMDKYLILNNKPTSITHSADGRIETLLAKFKALGRAMPDKTVIEGESETVVDDVGITVAG